MRSKSYYRRTALLAMLALLLLFGTDLEDSLAYFTTYTTARGSAVLHFGSKTEIEESGEGLEKVIQIKNVVEDGKEPSDCLVRIKILAGERLKDKLRYTKSDLWYLESDGYWYYKQVVPPNGSTDSFQVNVELDQDTNTELKELGITNFNVLVIQESVPVIYDDSGNPDIKSSWALYTVKEQSEEAGS